VSRTRSGPTARSGPASVNELPGCPAASHDRGQLAGHGPDGIGPAGHEDQDDRLPRTRQDPEQVIDDGLNVWNNFILPLVLTQSNSVAVLPLGLTKLEGQHAINVPAVMAAVLLSVLPLVVLFVVMRKQVMRSLGSVVMR
jgi:hypothetical protein